jgi:hypothetical protein
MMPNVSSVLSVLPDNINRNLAHHRSPENVYPAPRESLKMLKAMRLVHLATGALEGKSASNAAALMLELARAVAKECLRAMLSLARDANVVQVSRVPRARNAKDVETRRLCSPKELVSRVQQTSSKITRVHPRVNRVLPAVKALSELIVVALWDLAGVKIARTALSRLLLVPPRLDAANKPYALN